MTSQPINPPKPHQKVEFVTLKKFAKLHHYTPNNKKVIMVGWGGGTLCPPGCDEPKKPGLDRVKFKNLTVIRKHNMEIVCEELFTSIAKILSHDIFLFFYWKLLGCVSCLTLKYP